MFTLNTDFMKKIKLEIVQVMEDKYGYSYTVNIANLSNLSEEEVKNFDVRKYGENCFPFALFSKDKMLMSYDKIHLLGAIIQHCIEEKILDTWFIKQFGEKDAIEIINGLSVYYENFNKLKEIMCENIKISTFKQESKKVKNNNQRKTKSTSVEIRI